MSHSHRSIPARPPRRRRGGQPGNANAFKHGFYTPQFREKEKKAFDQLSLADLQAEMKTLRSCLRRYIRGLDLIAPGDHQAAQNALFSVCLVSSQLVALARVQSHGQFRAVEARAIKAWVQALTSEEDDKENMEAA